MEVRDEGTPGVEARDAGVRFGVLGPVVAWAGDGRTVDLRGPKHRAVLARLLVARGRVVPVGHLVDDLWVAPPEGAVAAVRTFVAALRRAVEPGRAPRARPSLLVTEGPGYAFRPPAGAVDAWRFEDAVVAGGPLGGALGWWRGPAYADFPDAPWARAERARLTELRLRAVELEASRLIDTGRPGDAVPGLDGHVTEHPWREEGWRLLATALYRAGRQGDALAVLRRARGLLAERLGVDPGPALRQLEVDILRRAPRLDGPEEPWSSAARAYDRLVAPGARGRLETTVGLLRSLAVAGGGDGLGAAQEQRLATIRAAEELGDPRLTARVIGAYDVPAIWPRPDDPARAAEVVAAARRTLAAITAGSADGDGDDAGTSNGGGPSTERGRLLATIAVESRGTGAPEDRAAAEEAVRIARRVEDPGLLAFALNGLYMQSFHRCGLAARRDAVGAELIALSERHARPTSEVLGHLIRLQARCALGDLDAAAAHARRADDLAEKHELPLVTVFTTWFHAFRRAASGLDATAGYLAAASTLDQAGMPGLSTGLLALAVHTQEPQRVDGDFGPYQPWIAPGPEALPGLPDPPHDAMAEILWCLAARAALRHRDRRTARRAAEALRPAAGEHAANGLVTLGPIRDVLAALDRYVEV